MVGQSLVAHEQQLLVHPVPVDPHVQDLDVGEVSFQDFREVLVQGDAEAEGMGVPKEQDAEGSGGFFQGIFPSRNPLN
jgi:hypothetical protein